MQTGYEIKMIVNVRTELGQGKREEKKGKKSNIFSLLFSLSFLHTTSPLQLNMGYDVIVGIFSWIR